MVQIFPAPSSGGLPAQPATTFVGADVTVSATANTFTTGITLGAALVAGASYLLMAHITLLAGGIAATYNVSFELYDSTNAVVIAQAELVGLAAAQANMSFDLTIPPVYYAGYAGTPTIIVRFAASSANGPFTIKAANASNSGGNLSSWITAMRVQ